MDNSEIFMQAEQSLKDLVVAAGGSLAPDSDGDAPGATGPLSGARRLWLAAMVSYVQDAIAGAALERSGSFAGGFHGGAEREVYLEAWQDARMAGGGPQLRKLCGILGYSVALWQRKIIARAGG